MDRQQDLTDGRPGADGLSLADVEAALLRHYTDLVRLAYLILPPALGRHRRILAAHGLVQRSMPDRRQLERAVPGEAAQSYIRRRVLQNAVKAAGSRTPLRLLPQVWGLRLFPRSGAADDLTLDQALAGLTPAARVAWALVRMEQLPVSAAEQLLKDAGLPRAQEAIREAAALDQQNADAASGPLNAAVFDPCAVQLAPTGLLRRRARVRAVAVIVAVVLAFGILAALIGSPGRDVASTDSVTTTAAAQGFVVQSAATDPSRLRRTPGDRWQDTARVDFTAWPVRGDRATDQALLGRALTTWASGSSAVRGVAGTPTTPPIDSPQLLYAGEVDGAAVVLLSDGQRLARYTEPRAGTSAILLSRINNADVTTAAAVAVRETPAGVRFLTAPWIATSEIRDLKKPDSAAKDLARAGGITAPVAAPPTNCSSLPTLQLRSSPTVAEKHAFLVTHLGGLSPVHLTYMPPPGRGSARSPREATSTEALVSWARTACTLLGLRDKGVKASNNWIFAQQKLPGAGRGNWVCTRSDSWEGNGWAAVRLLPGSSSTRPSGAFAGQATNTAACSRFGQHVLASAHWRSPGGAWYLLAAGSRHVRRIELTGAVNRSVNGASLAVASDPGSAVVLRGRLATGESLKTVADSG